MLLDGVEGTAIVPQASASLKNKAWIALYSHVRGLSSGRTIHNKRSRSESFVMRFVCV